MSTFHRFVDLPYDVRMLVWEYYALPAPDEPSRVVHINNWRHCFTSTAAPAIMHVCHDSRIVGLKYYRPSFACCATLKQRQKLDPQIDHTCRIPIWINFDVDTVKMSLHFFYQEWLSEFDLIQRLQLLSDDSAEMYLEFRLGYFRLARLKSVDIFHEGDMNTWYGQLVNPNPQGEYWGCDPAIIRVIGKGGTEIVDYESDRRWLRRRDGDESSVEPSEDEWYSEDNWQPGGNQ